jgi:hypothetical protein
MRILGTIASSSREVPNAPTIGTATDVGTIRTFTPQNGGGTVTFTAPTWTGGLPILDYTVTSSPSSFTATGASSPITVNGLAPNTNYTFTVRARNAVGSSAASAASNSMLATTVPAAPTVGTATRTNDTTVSLGFTAGATGGKTITSYTVTSSPSISLSTSGTTSPLTVTGTFASGQAYTFSITASNANGVSGASGSSNSVTPFVPKPVVTGGTLTSDATYYYRTFTANGTLGVSNSTLTADYVLVAGGGAGGVGRRSTNAKAGINTVWQPGGGGAGGVIYNTNQSIGVNSYSIVIGAGGTSTVTGSYDSTNGSNSTGISQTATGGGYGGGYYNTGGTMSGNSGGSGGGAGSVLDFTGPTTLGYTGSSGTAGQGNAGGNTPGTGNTDTGTAGGGGKGAVGGNATASSQASASGGSGSTYFGTTYAGGGGGGSAQSTGGSGGSGGGGAGNSNGTGAPTAGTANTGGGGGGGAMGSNGFNAGAAGGSGIFVIRYTKVQVD